MTSFRSFRLACAILAALIVSACSWAPRSLGEYRIDIQQGNVLSQEQVSQLRPGLTQEQVRFILGTPMLVDMFHADRWDYVYRFQNGRTDAVETRRFTVFFNNEGKLYRVSGDVVADQGGAAETPVMKSTVIDLGTVAPDAEMPVSEEKGFFRSMMEKIGF
jgi:outer membrane protein assembly factor BamE